MKMFVYEPSGRSEYLISQKVDLLKILYTSQFTVHRCIVLKVVLPAIWSCEYHLWKLLSGVYIKV